MTGRDRVGAGRRVVRAGTALDGLLAAVRATSGEDIAVWFDAVDLDAFEPAEEEAYEDVEDDGDAGNDDDDDAPASPRDAPAAPRATPADLDLGEFELVAPSLCVYAVTTPDVRYPQRRICRHGCTPSVVASSGLSSLWIWR